MDLVFPFNLTDPPNRLTPVRSSKTTISLSFEEIQNAPDAQTFGKIAYCQFQRLALEPGLKHAVFTRHGGVSNPPFDSLNTSYSTEDNPEHVRKNLGLVREVLGAGSLVYLNQVHGTNVLVLREGFPGLPQEVQADAVMTNRIDVALMVKQADCQGVILYEPDAHAVAIVHCGWRGNTLNILAAVVERMVRELGCRKTRILAAIGPSLGPCCAEFVTYRKIFPEKFKSSMIRENYFDLWQISRKQMLEAGVPDENIETARVCTVCRRDLFFSYRAEKTTGRFATAVMLV